MEPIVLYPHKTRVITFFEKDNPIVPKSLFSSHNPLPVDSKFIRPLPFRKKDCTCFFQSGDVIWLGSRYGVARYCEKEKDEYDCVMYFSADRDLKDNNVKSLYGRENEIWIETDTSIAHIELKMISAEKKAEMLLAETLNVVERQGMVSDKNLKIPYDLTSKEKFSLSDNDGGFTASFAIGEMMHYAVLKREKGENHPDTRLHREIAMRYFESCLLLMYISGRGDGFVARTYMTSDAPMPDDGLFFKKQGSKAFVLRTSFSIKRNIVGAECDASVEVPPRLAAIYRDLGYSDDDIIYKGDTSSDEITLHVINLYYGHMILGVEDSELDELIKSALSSLMTHIMEHDRELVDFHGEATSWAKWSKNYFSDGIGWGDAPLNAAELLMYLKVTMAVCQDDGKWQDEYNNLLADNYHLLPALHYDRAFASGISMGCEVIEDLMYGDHMLANLSFFGLMMLEKDEQLRDCYYKGWCSWRNTSIGCDHHPIYDIPFAVACPDDYVDREKIKMWFNRSNVSRLAASVSLSSRTDVPMKEYKAGYCRTSYLLPPDERVITKYDRDSLMYTDGNTRDKYHVETCCPYTMPYWMGRFYGLIKEGEEHEA